MIDKDLNEWIHVYKRNNNHTQKELPEIWFFEIRDYLKQDGYNDEEISQAINKYFNNQLNK